MLIELSTSFVLKSSYKIIVDIQNYITKQQKKLRRAAIETEMTKGFFKAKTRRHAIQRLKLRESSIFYHKKWDFPTDNWYFSKREWQDKIVSIGNIIDCCKTAEQDGRRTVKLTDKEVLLIT